MHCNVSTQGGQSQICPGMNFEAESLQHLLSFGTYNKTNISSILTFSPGLKSGKWTDMIGDLCANDNAANYQLSKWSRKDQPSLLTPNYPGLAPTLKFWQSRNFMICGGVSKYDV